MPAWRLLLLLPLGASGCWMTSSFDCLADPASAECGGGAKGTIYYLSPQGDDASNGTSPERAWRTFAHALGRLEPGATLLLADGEYGPAGSGLPDIDCRAGAKNG